MSISLLANKVRIPSQSRHTLRRDRLIDTVEQGIPEYKLINISAPAGYGKTTLLIQWALSSHYQAAWLTVTEEDNNLIRFFRYFLGAWEVIQPDIRESELGLLLGTLAPDRQAVMSAFVTMANRMLEHTVFIVDDYHLIEDVDIHNAIAFLLDQLPANFHLILSTRAEPPLPLARYRAQNVMLELRAEDLRFLPDETAEFLNNLMGLHLPDEEVIGIQNQLEGWIVGLQLAALSLQRHEQMDRPVISGKNRYIADYLSEDVLTYLPDKLQQFLLQTSILEHLCASLCDAVTNRDDGQMMLNMLERENLFVMPLDANREWFRYHGTFASFLQSELQHRQLDDIAVLHQRAARWHLANDMPESAYRHAVKGNEVEIVVQIFDRYVDAKLNSGEIRVVERWIDLLPSHWYEAYPVLGLARVGFLAFTGDFEACERCIDDVEQKLESTTSDKSGWQLARVIAVRCLMACMQNDLDRAESYASEALQLLPENDNHMRPGIYVALGDTHRRNGNWEAARESYRKALSIAEMPRLRFMSAHVLGALADLALRQGQLRDASGFWRQALEVIQEEESWGRLPLPIIGWVYIRSGELLYEWNELQKAWDHVSSGLERAELGGDLRSLIAGYLIAGRIRLTEGDLEDATKFLELARPHVETARFSHWISRFERLQLELWLARDMLRTAVLWSDKMLDETISKDHPESEVAQLAMARVMIFQGGESSVERAFALLQQLLQRAEAEGRAGIIIESETLQALAHQKCNDGPKALIALERALRLAEPEGYVRRFADYGMPMARLLQEAHSRQVMPDYTAKLLAAFTDVPSSDSSDFIIPEPLTPREQEILNLMSAGLTNREIGDELVISPGTVKKHAASIYGKLCVNNRTEAAAKARDLNLLD